MASPIIEFCNVSKSYLKNKKDFYKYFFKNKTQDNTFKHVLKDINLHINKGECLGIIGTNGAGKSTLLKLIAKIEKPSKGIININGKVRPILELGASFDYSLTGRENIFLSGLLLGYLKNDIEKKINEIINFSGIKDSIDNPLYFYSSGMIMRLAFAIQILTDPDILIIDEALSVGDFFFQQKCFKYINGLRKKKVTIIFVSHDMSIVRNLCSKVIHIKDGVIIDSGSAASVVSNYFNQSNNRKISKKVTSIPPKKNPVFGNNSFLYEWQSNDYLSENIKLFGIKAISLKTENEDQKLLINSNLIFEISSFVRSAHDKINIGFRNKLGLLITSIVIDNYDLKSSQFPCMRKFIVTFKLSLEAGVYSSKVVYTKNVNGNDKTLHVVDNIGPINILWQYDKNAPPFHGLVGLKHIIEKF